MIPRLPRAAWIVLGGDALSALGSGMTLPFLLVYLHSVRGLSLTLAGLAVATIALASLVGNPLGGSLTDRASARATLIAGLLLAATGAMALLAVREPWHAFAATATLASAHRSRGRPRMRCWRTSPAPAIARACSRSATRR